MTTLERIDNFRRLWSAILPKLEKGVIPHSGVRMTVTYKRLECPGDDQIWRWIRRFDDSLIEHGLTRLRSKIQREEIVSSDSAGRYLTAVLCAEQERRAMTLAGDRPENEESDLELTAESSEAGADA